MTPPPTVQSGHYSTVPAWTERVEVATARSTQGSLGLPLLIQDPAALTPALLESANDGAHIVVVIEDPAGAAMLNRIPGFHEAASRGTGEWIVAPNRAHPALGRMPEEFPTRGTITTFVPPIDAIPLATVNIALHNHVFASQHTVGKGRITIIGMDLANLRVPQSWMGRLMELLTARAPRVQIPSYGVGIIGYGPYGGMGLYHGRAAAKTPGLQLVSAVDADKQRIQQAEADFPGLIGYASSAELFNDDITDVVIIATPPNTHYELALAALEADKHVVAEKPLCITVAQADKLIEVAEAHDRILTVHQNRRWDQDYRTLVQLIGSGVIGEVFNIETSVSTFDHPCRAWHSDTDVSGGLAYDWGAHHIDWINQLYGMTPDRVYAFGHKRRWHEMTNLDQLRIHLQFSGGREATFFQSEIDGFRRPKFYVQGTEGTIIGTYRPIEQAHVEPVAGYSVTRYHYAEAPTPLEVAIYEGPGRLSHYSPELVEPDIFGFQRDLADHLLVGTPLAVQASDIRGVVAVLELAHRSRELGAIQSLPRR